MRAIHPAFRPAAAATLTLAAALAGCSGDTGPTDAVARVPVSGSVTMDGTPLPQGTIQFVPAKGSSAVTVVTEITDGKYAFDRTSGPSPGKYLVSVSTRVAPKLKEGEAPGGTPKLPPETIPAQYNAKTKLEAEIKEGASTQDFALKKS